MNYPVQQAVPGGEANLTEQDAAKFASLPLDARSRISALPPEMRASAIRTFPTPDEDRATRTAKERARRREIEDKDRNRRELCRRALSGEEGAAVKKAALDVLRRHNINSESFNVSDFQPTTVQDIVQLLQKSGGKR